MEDFWPGWGKIEPVGGPRRVITRQFGTPVDRGAPKFVPSKPCKTRACSYLL